MNAEPSLEGRRPEIDWVKGWAILCVLLIHSKPFEAYAIQDLINRAVPVFVVVFGMTSERWWRARASLPLGEALGQWYRTRLWRLMVPLWGTLVVWWVLEAGFRQTVAPEPHRVLMTALGYLPWVGTGWFVTLILELVLVFPLVHFGLKAAGDTLGIVVAVAVLALSYAEMLAAIELMRTVVHDTALPGNTFFYFWIFVPARLYAVTVGAVLVRRRVVVRPWQAVACFGVALILANVAHWAQLDVRAQRAAVALADPFVTVGLLGLIPAVAWWTPGARLLAWCGIWSWGLYLGQLLVHDVFFAFGMDLARLSVPLRFGYFACLFVGAVGLAVIGQAIREMPLREWFPRRPTRSAA